MRKALIRHIDIAAAVDGLRCLSVNYDEADAPVPHQPGNWHVDNPRTLIGHEPAGAPVPGGAWETGCALVGEYEEREAGEVRNWRCPRNSRRVAWICVIPVGR